MAKSTKPQDAKIDLRTLTESDQASCQRLNDVIREELDDEQKFLAFVFTPLPDDKCAITVVGDVCQTFAAEWIQRYFQQARARGVQ